jgi:hypothetical protein
VGEIPLSLVGLEGLDPYVANGNRLGFIEMPFA